MPKIYVATAAAIVLFGAGSVAIIALMTDGSEQGPVLAAERGQASTPAPPPPPIGSEVGFEAVRHGLAIQALPPPPVIHDDPPPVPPKGSWEAVKVVARPAALGPVGAALGRELNELEPQLSACFDEVTQARWGPQGFTAVQDYERSNDRGTTVLMLELETLQGAVRIVDAPVETRGNASDGLITCAQHVLRGQVVPAPEARAGSRHRLQFPLQQ